MRQARFPLDYGHAEKIGACLAPTRQIYQKRYLNFIKELQ